jgi:galactonate dehydratase
MNPRIAHIRFHPARATPRTIWLFVSVMDAAGRTGWGEATLEGAEPAVAAVADRMIPDLLDLPGVDSATLGGLLPFQSLPEAAFSSAILQAMADIEAQRTDLPLAIHLGADTVTPVPVYANFNRRTVSRTPEGMAASARTAASQGHVALKIAPFDEVTTDLDRPAMRRAMDMGLARLAAIRDAVGPDAALMADCHWRFDTTGAQELISAAAPLGLYWIECPIAESPEQIPALVDLRRRANGANMRLAGLEMQIGLDGFRPYLDAGAYDVMMPDVKYAGGPGEMMRIAAALHRAGVAFSPHNPTGPVCHAHSLHICAAVGAGARLEMQFDESPMFDGFCETPVPGARDGCVDAAARGPGLGLALRPDLLGADRPMDEESSNDTP